jgi:undecaprenyl phosphate N,N'-diacetylbacillosamine 1-phosphate transferase
MYKKFIKRFLDLILSLMALILLMPLMLIIYILVRVKLGKPAIFKQERPGKDEKIFTLYKFRTMTDEKDENGNLLPDEQRLTKFGKMLRSTSLDELPELVNIIKGDMSIVGPRPLLVRDMVFMTEIQRKRHSVRQGLTGLAQVNGRNNITWEEKIKYDLNYVENISFINDVKIILKTVIKVFKREDTQTDGMQTAEDLGDYLVRTNKISKDDYTCKNKEALKIIQKFRENKRK